MTMAMVEAQVPHKVTQMEEGTTKRGLARGKTVYEFQKGTPENKGENRNIVSTTCDAVCCKLGRGKGT